MERARHDARHKRAAVETEMLRTIVENAGPPAALRDLRDRALILFNFGNARRRSEIAALDYEDLEFRDNGVFISIRRSKTDQRGVGRTTWLPRLAEPDQKLCAHRALLDWIRAADIREGPLFRTFDLNGRLTANRIDGRDVTRALKRVAAAAGLPSEQIARIASHSLRRGFVTSADRAGASVHAIMKVTLHKDRRTVDVYVKRDLERDSP
ncbi:MAG: site-specific integrase, partial [Vulcanimicrobiaceae bacterium]